MKKVMLWSLTAFVLLAGFSVAVCHRVDPVELKGMAPFSMLPLWEVE